MSTATLEKNRELQQYLQISGQTIQEVMAGASQTGIPYVLKLISQALVEHKKIVWKVKNEHLGTGKYILQ